MIYKENTIYEMRYTNSEPKEIMICTKITESKHYFTIISSEEYFVHPGLQLAYSKRDLTNLYRYVIEYPKEDYPEYYL